MNRKKFYPNTDVHSQSGESTPNNESMKNELELKGSKEIQNIDTHFAPLVILQKSHNVNA